MAEWKQKRVWWWLSLLFFLCLVLDHKIAQAKRPISSEMENHNKTTFEAYRHLFANAFGALFEPGDSTTRVWPVASATSTFAMTFSSSMSVIQYYLLDRFLIRAQVFSGIAMLRSVGIKALPLAGTLTSAALERSYPAEREEHLKGNMALEEGEAERCLFGV